MPITGARARVCALTTAQTSLRLISTSGNITKTALLARDERQTHYDMLIRCAPRESPTDGYSFLRYQHLIRLAMNQLQGVMYTLSKLSTVAALNHARLVRRTHSGYYPPPCDELPNSLQGDL